VSRRASLAPLADRQFRYFFASRAVNLAGSMMAPIALSFAVLAIEDSATALGQVLAARSVPMVVFLLLGGVIADRIDRRLVIQVSNVISALSQGLAAYLVITGQAELWHLVVIEAVNGTSSAASFPAMQGMFPQLVPRDQLQSANVLTSMMRSVLTIVGPSVAGILVVTLGAGWALAIDGITYLASAALLLKVVLPAPARRSEGTSTITELREGWTFFRQTTWLWVVVLAFCALCALHQGGFFTLGPVLAKGTAIGEQGWGLILSAEAAGLLVTSLVMLRLRLERPLFWGMLGTALYGLPMIALGLDPNVATTVVAAFAAGAGIEVFSLGWNLAMQEHIPDHLLSRAFSYDALGSMAAVPLGQLAAGPLAEAFGIQPVILVAGFAVVAVALITLSSASVRNLQRHTTSELSPAAR
jgi:MFS family permease